MDRLFERANRRQRAALRRAFERDPTLYGELESILRGLGEGELRDAFERAFLEALPRHQLPAAAVMDAVGVALEWAVRPRGAAGEVAGLDDDDGA